MQPIYTVQSHPIPSGSLNLRTQEITDAIVQAAQSNGWLVDRIGPSEVRATQKWRDHAAVVLISHDGKTFNIRNDGSTNLKQHDDVIHRAYNSRVQALETAIEKRLYRN